MDKIIGENILTEDDLFLYFFIFKLSSTFQILGSILTQPTRNKVLKSGNINNLIKKEINFFIIVIFLFLLFTNIIIISAQNYLALENIKPFFNFQNILIFNLWSLVFTLHIFNGFYIDGIFIKGYSNKIIFYNFLVLIIQLAVMTIFDKLIFWTLSIFLGQIILTIFSFIYYNSHVQYKINRN